MNFNKNISSLKQDNLLNHKLLILSIQHLFAMFGSTILIPQLIGLDPSVALFTSGLGTLIFHMITKGMVPAYLGSSFAFVPAILLAQNAVGTRAALTGMAAAGLMYVLIGCIIKKVGIDSFKKLLPPVVIGPVIMLIGLSLAPVAKDMASTHYLTAVVTLLIAICVSIYSKGVMKITPILTGIIGGYLFSITQGLVDFNVIKEASWLAIPKFQLPQLVGGFKATTLIVPLALVAMVEHLGDVMAISSTAKKDFIKRPGLHRTLIGDGIATIIAALFGGPPNTTYGENVGVLAITKIYNPLIIQLTAVLVILVSFIEKFGVTIRTIPQSVMGGIVFLLFGMIASVGLRTVVENKVDFNNTRNLIIASLILVIGLSGVSLMLFGLEIAGIGLAAIVGIIANLILKDEEGVSSADTGNKAA